MGSLTHIKGDLFSTSNEVIAHGCNVRGRFSSGVAGLVRKRYPEAYRAYMRKYEKDGWGMGDVQVVMTDQYNRYVANMATQEGYGYDGKRYVDYDAVRKAFLTVFEICEGNRWSLALPRIGCGLGGGEWPVVEGIIREELASRDVEVEAYAL